ncbi:MAG: Holliday junction resolvase RuvX [Bacteroidota bacterium]
MTKEKKISELIKNKKLCAIDFGLKRVGMATCDPMHVTVSPKYAFFFQEDNFWDELLKAIEIESPALIVLGMPYRNGTEESDIVEEIKRFRETLERKTGLKVIYHDESYTSKLAVATMIETKMKKKRRQQKENIDKFSAAIILRDFLEDYPAG